MALGLRLRLLRVRASLRQEDLAAAAAVPRGVVSQLENGVFRHASLDAIERVANGLGAAIDVRIRWHGEDLDRLIDAAHAATVAAIAERLEAAGWTVWIEASFSIWGERGSIDVLAWHLRTRILLVIEVKSVIPDIQAMLHDLDRKVRLAPTIVAGRGWRPAHVARLVVVAESPTSRGRARRDDVVLGAALPDRGRAVRSWLSKPDGAVSGLLFLSNAQHSHTRRAVWRRQRVHRRKPCRSPRHQSIDKERPGGRPPRGGPSAQ